MEAQVRLLLFASVALSSLRTRSYCKQVFQYVLP